MHDVKPTMETQAAEWFLRRQRGHLSPQDAAALQSWLAESPEHLEVWRETEKTWQSFGDHATMPELVVAREKALASVRRTQSKRWAKPLFLKSHRGFAASAAVVVLSLGALWQFDVLRGERYGTDIAEQRTVLLPDGSNVALDAVTRIRVRYDEQVRLIELLEGQAQFDVAAESRRPFRVRVGSQVVEALGTSFTVAYIDKRLRVALIEGRVRVEPVVKAPMIHAESNTHPQMVMNAGDTLRIEPDGQQELKEHADLTVATAWRQGKVIFQQEPLRDAVEQLNRYSRVRIEVADSKIEQWPVSGIFGVGDAEAFAEAIASYFPIQAHRSGDDVIELKARR